MRFIGGIIVSLLALMIPITARAEEFYLPDEVIELTYQYESGCVTAELIQAVIWRESRGDADAVNTSESNVGLMQLSVKYFDGDLTDPENNVSQGVDYLKSLIDKHGCIELALMKYHGERDAVEKYQSGQISTYASGIIEMAETLKEERMAKIEEEMKKVRYIDYAIYRLIDTETGEILDDERMSALQIAKDDAIEELLGLRASEMMQIAGIDAEIKRLNDLKAERQGLCDRVEKWIDNTLGGNPYDSPSGLYKVKYSKSQETECFDMNALMEWDDLGLYFRFGDPKPIKAEIKKAIKNGQSIPGCRVVDKQNMSIK